MIIIMTSSNVFVKDNTLYFEIQSFGNRIMTQINYFKKLYFWDHFRVLKLPLYNKLWMKFAFYSSPMNFQPVGDYVLPCNTLRMLVYHGLIECKSWSYVFSWKSRCNQLSSSGHLLSTCIHGFVWV